MSFMIKDLAKQGDILLYRATHTSPWHDKLIALGEILLKERVKYSPAIYYHCSFAVGDGTQYEEVVPKARQSVIPSTEGIELWRVKDITPEQISIASRWSKAHLSAWYNISPYVFGLFSFKNTYTCSEYVRDAFLAANINLSQDKDKIFSPDDLITDKIFRVC